MQPGVQALYVPTCSPTWHAATALHGQLDGDLTWLPAKMQLTSSMLLSAWEHGVSQAPLRRALTLLAAACPEKSVEEWADLSLGKRDRKLLALRAQWFGPHLEAVSACPRCGERLELNFRVEDILTAEELERDEVTVAVDHYELRCRLPTSRDLLEALEAARKEKRSARQVLLERCISVAAGDGVPLHPDVLPDQVLRAADSAVAQSDPQAEVLIAVDCPACAHHWSIDFDVMTYLWSEIDDWATRLMREVHILARAYGWTEGDILSLNNVRRQRYLAMIGEDGL